MLSKRNPLALKRFVFQAVLLLLGIGFLAEVYAQTSTVGNISGTVRDQSGAAVQKAQVIIEEESTGLSRTVTTDDDGLYSAQKLPVGKYTVTATAQGFKKVVQSGIELHAGDDLTINFNFEVGTITDTVTITAGAPLVETTNGDVSSLISEKQVTELPLNGRNFAQLVLVVPGISAGEFKTGGVGLDTNVSFSANGNGTNENMWTVDGVNNLDIGSNGTLLVFPSIDSIAEVKIERNNFGVEFGQSQGAVVNVITKGGGNAFHGSAWEFFRNDKLNANDFSLNAAGKPKPPLRYNNFGFNINGPIKKEKAFFFWSEEWRFENRSLVREGKAPTAAEKAGDFSGILTGPRPVDPATCRTVSGQRVCDPFPGNRIPANRLSPFGLAFVKLYSDANNLSNPTGTNFIDASTSPIRTRQDLIRGDWTITKNMNLMSRFINEKWTRGAPAGLWGDDPFPVVDSNWDQPSKSFAVKLTNTLSPTTVNDFQFSASGNILVSSPTGDTALLDEINSKFPTIFPFKSGERSHPVMWAGGGYNTLWNHAPWKNIEDLYVWKDDFSKVMGTHTIKAGALFSHNIKDEPSYDTDGDDRQFFEGGDSTGNVIADILLKDLRIDYTEQNVRKITKLRWQDLEFYGGDTWKVRSNITATYGLRWSRYGNAYDADDQITNFIPRLYDGRNPNSALVLPGQKGFNRSVVEQFNAGFQPRIGIAWDVNGDGKTAVRLGIGRYMSRTNIGRWLGLGLNPPWVGSISTTQRTFDSVPPGLANQPLAFTTNYSAINEKFPPPESWQWNLTLSRELFRDTGLEVSYVGNHGLHLWRRVAHFNDIIPSRRVAVAQSIARFGADDPRTTALIASSRRFPGVGNIRLDENTGNSTYHSLQVWLNKRFSKGLAYQAAYTWSHAISDVPVQGFAQGVTDSFDYSKDKGSSDLDRRHMLITNLVYEMPGLKDWGSLAENVIGGWQVGLIATFLTGRPFEITTGNANRLGLPISGVPIVRPDLVPGQPIYLDGPDKLQHLNPKAFALPAIGVFGNLGKGVVRGPGSHNFDFSLAKNWRMMETKNIQFRFEVFNLFNHPVFNVVNNDLSSGSFGQLQRVPGQSDYRGPREIQLGLKFSF